MIANDDKNTLTTTAALSIWRKPIWNRKTQLMAVRNEAAPVRGKPPRHKFNHMPWTKAGRWSQVAAKLVIKNGTIIFFNSFVEHAPLC